MCNLWSLDNIWIVCHNRKYLLIAQCVFRHCYAVLIWSRYAVCWMWSGSNDTCAKNSYDHCEAISDLLCTHSKITTIVVNSNLSWYCLSTNMTQIVSLWMSLYEKRYSFRKVRNKRSRTKTDSNTIHNVHWSQAKPKIVPTANIPTGAKSKRSANIHELSHLTNRNIDRTHNTL